MPLAPLPEILRNAGYTSAALTGAGLMPRRGQPELPLFEQLHRCEGGGTTELLSRLFVLGLPQPAADVDRVLQPLGIAPLIACGLLEAIDDTVTATTTLLPSGDFLIARDFAPSITGRPAPDDQVLPVGQASMLTAGLAVRRSGETMLDLGCGQGVQMLLAARHADRLIGTDIAARSLKIAAFNLALNAHAINRPIQTEFRLGSFFEPVEDLRAHLDLIVSNPPFVITPRTRIVGYTAGLRGDQTVETVFSNAPAFLAEGGWCVSLGNWHHATPDDWPDRPHRWIEGKGCDALIGKIETMHPRTYALKWIRGTDYDGAPTPEQMHEWMSMLDDLGAGAITFGFVALRRRAGRNWIHHEHIDYDYHAGPAGDQLRRAFDGRTLLHELGAAPPDRVYRAAPGLTISERRTNSGTKWSPGPIILSQSPGIPWPLEADPVTAAALAACDGTRTLRQAARKAARDAGAEENSAIQNAVAAATELLRRGMLTA